MNESLKELAVRYFEGPIAPEEECELFGFLAASPENAALMREWEREWKQRHVPSADVLRSLAREYDVKIELCTDAFDDKTFRISLTEAQDIESIMGGLCDILPISVRRDTCGYRVDSRPRKTEP